MNEADARRILKTPKFSKRDYAHAAKCIRETRHLFAGNEAQTVIAVVVSKFATDFHDDNPAFDIERFIKEGMRET